MSIERSTVVFIPTAKVEAGLPSPWLRARLDSAGDYCLEHEPEIAGIVISGRGPDVMDAAHESEAAVAGRYLRLRLAGVPIALEEFATETGGNHAFSKPLIAEFGPQKVVAFNSSVYEDRMRYFAQKIFGPAWHVELRLVNDELASNERAITKEPRALKMFRSLFDAIPDGDDAEVRRVLLAETPFYDRTRVDNEAFFDARWPGGFADYADSVRSKDNR
jgi:hypothetical protein